MDFKELADNYKNTLEDWGGMPKALAMMAAEQAKELGPEAIMAFMLEDINEYIEQALNAIEAMSHHVAESDDGQILFTGIPLLYVVYRRDTGEEAKLIFISGDDLDGDTTTFLTEPQPLTLALWDNDVPLAPLPFPKETYCFSLGLGMRRLREGK